MDLMGESDNGQISSSFSLSVVVPVYNEVDACPLFLKRILPILSQLTDRSEIVFVDDGSNDGTLGLLADVHADDPRIKVITLTRNFGKELALTAGLDHANGDAVIPMDVDMQDPPDLIPELVARWQEGFDMVLAVRVDRSSDSFMKRASAGMFYNLMSRMSDVELPPNVGDFRLMDRKVVDALKLLPERTRFMKGLFAWLGFTQTSVEYARPVRAAGETKWRYWRLWNFALEGVFSFSTLPLRIWTYFGASVAFLALLLIGYIVVRKIMFGIDIEGYASLIVTVLFFSGVNMVGLGILGEYLGRVFLEVKQRPRYLIRDSLGIDDRSL